MRRSRPPTGGSHVSAKPQVHEFGMGVDVHGRDATKAACRAVSDAIRHSSLPLFQEVRERGGRMLVDVTVGVPDPDSVKLDVVRRELPHGEVTVRDLTDLARARQRLIDAGALVGSSNHGVSLSLYAKDPDGLEFEIFWTVPGGTSIGTRELDLEGELARRGITT